MPLETISPDPSTAPITTALHLHHQRALAHDVRNMVTQLALVSDEMADHPDPRIRKLAGRIERAIGRVVSICRDTEGREGDPDADAAAHICRPGQILQEVAGLVSVGAGRKTRVEVSTSFDGPVRSCPDEVFRLTMNLATNAIRAVQSVGGGTVMLHAGREQTGFWTLEISDTGPGMPESALKRLLDPAAPQPPGRKVSGLQLARMGAGMLGGTLTVPESRPGCTRVHVRFSDG